MPILQEVLAPQIIFQSVTSRVKKMGDPLCRFFGVQIGSSNAEHIDGRVGSYDIFDHIRIPAGLRAPNTGPARKAANPVHAQPVTVARVHEAVPMYYDRIFPLRKMGQPASNIDQAGADYIARQEGVLRSKFAYTREWLVAGMMRGSCQVLVVGEDWVPVLTGGTYTIDWQVPAGNKTDLDMLGAGPIIDVLWSDTTNADIFTQIQKIDKAFLQLHGWPLKHIWINGVTWADVTNNAGLKSRSGSSNIVMENWTGLGRVNNTDTTDDEQTAQIRCLPGITWHIYNGGLNLNGTFTTFFPDTGAGSAVFCPEPDPDWVTSILGTEYVQENEMQPAVKREGPYFWPNYHREPAMIELVGLDLFLPALRVPKCMAVGTVR